MDLSNNVRQTTIQTTPPRVSRSTCLALALVLGLWLGAAPAFSDASPKSRVTPVSTSPSPSPSEAPDAPESGSRQQAQTPPQPLTRAAAQSRLDAISPVDWLARFGHVEIEARD